MALMLVSLQRRPDLSRKTFADHWQGAHARLVCDLAPVLGITRYVQVHPEDTAAPWDGLAQVWFDARDTLELRMGTALGRAAARQLRADERNFIDVARSITWWAATQVVF